VWFLPHLLSPLTPLSSVPSCPLFPASSSSLTAFFQPPLTCLYSSLLQFSALLLLPYKTSPTLPFLVGNLSLPALPLYPLAASSPLAWSRRYPLLLSPLPSAEKDHRYVCRARRPRVPPKGRDEARTRSASSKHRLREHEQPPRPPRPPSPPRHSPYRPQGPWRPKVDLCDQAWEL